MRTVYVIGAGASVEAGLPTGEKLKEDISKFLTCEVDDWGDVSKVDKILSDSIFSKYKTQKERHDLGKLCNRVACSMPLTISIDNFIDNHRDSQDIAQLCKLAIVKCIAASERSSKIFQFITDESKSYFLSDTWYSKLFQLLSQNCNLHEFEQRLSLVSFVIFNYDRCIESFLVAATQLNYGIDYQSAKSIIEKINFIHPYGWLNSPFRGDNSATKLGDQIDAHTMLELTNNIRTFTEGIDKQNEGQELEYTLQRSQRVIFLGFAFHPLNMKHFKHDTFNTEAKEIYATTYGMSASDVELVENQLSEIFTEPETDSRPRIRAKNLTCFELFNEFQLSLGYEHQKRFSKTQKLHQMFADENN
ncbi:MAG: hypothetical protein ACI9O6_001426 [Glaciecola sp.]|jgi:hypothetical protein